MREDRYVKDRWVTLGNVANSKLFSREFIADSICERGMLIRDMAAIKATKTLLACTGCRWHFTSLCPLNWPDPYDNKVFDHADVFGLYQDVLDCMLPSFIDVLGFEYWYQDKETRPRHDNGGLDYHPTPLQHLKFVDHVFPGWVTNSEIRSKIAEETSNIQRRRSGVCKQTRL